MALNQFGHTQGVIVSLSLRKGMENMQWVCYTDGSCLDQNSGTGGSGAWAFHAIFGDQTVEKSCGYFKTTNNRMEILAIISFLEEFQEPTKITIRTDSQYTIDSVTKWIYGWIKNNWVTSQGQPVKNKDLFERLFKLVKFHTVTFEKVLAHSGIEGNERADELAKEAAGNPTLVDEGYTPPDPNEVKPIAVKKPWWMKYKKK